MDELNAKVVAAKAQMNELNNKISNTSDAAELKGYNDQIQAIISDLSKFLATNIAAQ